MYERVLKDNKDYLHPFSTYIIGSLFILVFFLAGCGSSDYRPEAIGKEGEILVVIDSVRWNGEVGEILREELGQYIGTLPQPEREFILRPASIDAQLNNIKQFKNVVIVAPLSDSSNVALFLRSRLGEEGENMLNRIGGMVVPKQNLWRRNQMVVYVTAPTAEDLVNIIDQKGEDLRYLFNEKTRERLTRDMFEKGRQFEIEEKLMERHDFAVNAQHDYYIAIDTTNFVWLRRVLSDTWRSLFVYYIENANPAVLSEEWIYATRDSLTKKYIRGTLGGFVEIDRRMPLETENINFLGRYGFESRGLWQMMGEREDGTRFQFAGGGPFLTYTFYDEPSGRIYMIDGMVFAPGYEKREFLRQMEVIAHTFRTKQDVENQMRVASTAP